MSEQHNQDVPWPDVCDSGSGGFSGGQMGLGRVIDYTKRFGTNEFQTVYHWGHQDCLPNSYSRRIRLGKLVCFVSTKGRF